MNAWTIIGLVLAAVLLLIFLLLMLPIRLLVAYDPAGGISFKVKLWIFTLNKNKPETKEEKEGKGEKQKPTPKQEKLTDNLRELIAVVKSLLGSVDTLLKHVRIKRLHIAAVIAGDNAADVAMEYGVACSVLYPFIGYLKSVMKVDERGLDVGLSCDFEREQSELSLSATLSVLLLFGGLTLLKFLMKQAEE